MSEYELLLDEQDMQYQSYGRMLDSHITHYITHLQHYTQHLPHEDCVSRLVNALARPCFPYRMKVYAGDCVKDVGILQLQLQLQVDGVLGRIWDSDGGANSSHTHTHTPTPSPLPLSQTHAHTHTHPDTHTHSYSQLSESINALHVLHTGILLLQMHEVEATLRV
ncbi:hypothetical protein EON63_17730, partial [archaeon]